MKWKEEITLIDEKVKAENQQKKEYLGSYRQHVRRIGRIEAELEEIRSMKASPSAINNNGMPSGSDQRDLSDYAAALDEMERELLGERYQRTLMYKDIAKRIKSLKSTRESDVMFYRYIKGMPFWEIALKMDMSERQILRIHGKALAHVEIGENFKNVVACHPVM